MEKEIKIPVMAEVAESGEEIEILLWAGCAASFDSRAQKIIKALVKILHYANVKFATLGDEESCTGDPAKRAGNEFVFQMQAMQNIEILNGYNVKKILTLCPHCFNTFKNEYPELGGNYEVYHHTEFINQLIKDGRLKVQGGLYKGKKITYHDSCYLGRANGIYEAPRELLEILDTDYVDMPRCRENGFCCGAGGAQMFKESEPGKKEINVERTEEALSLNPKVITTACPFCMTMITDGVKFKEKEQEVQVKDIAEIIVEELEKD